MGAILCNRSGCGCMGWAIQLSYDHHRLALCPHPLACSPLWWLSTCAGQEWPGYWTHNFFMYEQEQSFSRREFTLVPWDMDGAFPGVAPPEDPIGARPDYDAPVCDPDVQSGKASHPGNACIKCDTFPSTGGLSRSVPPSCLGINRAFFGLALRELYMNAAKEALTGPLSLCRINKKVPPRMPVLWPLSHSLTSWYVYALSTDASMRAILIRSWTVGRL